MVCEVSREPAMFQIGLQGKALRNVTFLLLFRCFLGPTPGVTFSLLSVALNFFGNSGPVGPFAPHNPKGPNLEKALSLESFSLA